jgi:hypothetical protein
MGMHDSGFCRGRLGDDSDAGAAFSQPRASDATAAADADAAAQSGSPSVPSAPAGAPPT